MKKFINYALITVLLIVGIFILTGCDNNKNNTDSETETTEISTGTVNSESITLICNWA